MDMTALAAIVLAAVAAGGAAYVFIHPLLSGEARAEKRQKAFVGEVPARRAERVSPGVSRREQVAQSLKEIEAREKAKGNVTLDVRLAQAGLNWSKRKFYAASAILGLAVGAVLFVTTNPYVALGGLFAGAFGMPRWILARMKKRRIKKFLLELPNAMDVIVRGLRAGLPLADCMRVIANEAQEPVRSEFRAIVESQALGISIGDACEKLFERVPVAEANFFGIVIQIQQKSGGNLSEVLGNLSKVLRDRRKMDGKIKAMSSEAKASAAIIACLPFTVAILTYLSSPSYIQLLWTTQAGQIGLLVSAVWMTVGVTVMKKMISFDF